MSNKTLNINLHVIYSCFQTVFPLFSSKILATICCLDIFHCSITSKIGLSTRCYNQGEYGYIIPLLHLQIQICYETCQTSFPMQLDTWVYIATTMIHIFPGLLVTCTTCVCGMITRVRVTMHRGISSTLSSMMSRLTRSTTSSVTGGWLWNMMMEWYVNHMHSDVSKILKCWKGMNRGSIYGLPKVCQGIQCHTTFYFVKNVWECRMLNSSMCVVVVL